MRLRTLSMAALQCGRVLPVQPMKRLLLYIGVLLALTVSAQAQNVFFQVPPSALGPAVFIFPASAVNGGGVVTGTLKLPDGTAAAPSLTFANNTNRGLFNDTSNSGIGFSVAGSQVGFWDASKLSVQSLVASGNIITSGGYFSAGAAASQLFLSTDGLAQFVNNGQTTFTRIILGANNATTNGASWGLNSGVLEAKTGDATAFIPVKSSSYNVNSAATIGAVQNKLIQINDTANAVGVELNVGTPTLGTCTGGSLVSGGKNSLFEVTGNSSGSCVVNFGTPIWQNAPLCFVNDETALIAVRISARTTNSITVTGAGSGDAFQVYCLGRVGT